VFVSVRVLNCLSSLVFVFDKFVGVRSAPWCGHCKKMAPDWEKLMEEFKDSPGVLIADVDCTSDGGKPLCQEFGVRGYPTLKYGDPSDFQPYQSGRDFESLKKFATESLKPACGPLNVDACTSDQLATLKELQALPSDKLEEKLAAVQAELKEAEAEFTVAMKKLTDVWESTKKEKTSSIAMMKAVKLAPSAEGEKKEEL
jgi:thiol-disulfide isomerase/thioredoxin